MKTVRLSSLDIRDFKAQNIHVDFSQETHILGRNRAGKSTILDAILWCLMGIDAEGRANYRLFDENREFNHQSSVPASVELRITIDGDQYSFRRVARQQWVRRRSSSEYVKADTDEYRYYIDGVEIPAKDYAIRVADILCAPDKLRLILNIGHYLNLKWQDLRKQFADIVGEITPDMYKGDYSDINRLAEKYHSEDIARQSVANAISENKKQLVVIKASIDTLRSQYPDLSHVEEAKAEIVDLEKKATDIVEQMADIKESLRPFQEKYSEEERRIQELKSQLLRAESEFNATQQKNLNNLELALKKAQSELSNASQANSSAAYERDSRQRRLESAQKDFDYWHGEYDNLRRQSEDTRKWTFEDSNFSSCQLCGSPLSGKSLVDAKAKFDEYKDHELLRIKNLGLSARSKWEEAEKTIARIKDESTMAKTIDLAPLHSAVETARSQFDSAKASAPSFADSPICATINAQIQDIEQHRTAIPFANTADLANEHAEILVKIKSYMAVVSLPAIKDNIDAKIQEKLTEQSAVAQALADNECIMAQFVERDREKAAIIGQLANRNLIGASVTMTTLSKAGEIVDCCEVRDESGIGSSTTNSASQMRIGISLSRCFAAAFGLDMPIIIDNAERMDSQSLETASKGIGQIVTMSVADCDFTIR